MTVIGAAVPTIPALWRAAQATSVAAAVGVVALLALRPDLGLFLTWYVLVPLVPAALLVAPRVWRNLCPIAVVHQLPALLGAGGRRRLSRRVQRWSPGAAAVGLFLIVPLRHPLFNEHGPALAVFVLAVLVLAALGGALFAGKGGWCASFCPVVPVERLYGQLPLLEPRHAHCATCVGCSDPCFDRDGAPGVVALLGETERSVARPAAGAGPGTGRHEGLLRSPTGIFGAAFPGFVLGYFTVPPDAGIGAIYVQVAATALAAALLLTLAQQLFRFPARTGIRLAAAAAATLYYWFTVPAVAAATERVLAVSATPDWGVTIGRSALIGLVAIWLLDAPRRASAVANRAAYDPAGVPQRT